MSSDRNREAGAAGPVRLQTVKRNRVVWYVSKWFVLLFSKLYFRIRFEGSDRLPKDGSVLLVANHASYLDPGMVGISASREVDFLAQAGLASFAPFRWWLAQVGVTLIDRDAPSKASMRLISDCLKAGEVVGIFPEGTRSHDGRIKPFKSGVEFLVRRTKTTVVPIGVDGSFRAFSRKHWFPRPRKIVVRYGQPWTAEQVLAPGGIEALRREVAELSRCELVPARTAEPTATTDGKAVSPPSSSAGAGDGPMIDPPQSSTSASAGGGA